MKFSHVFAHAALLVSAAAIFAAELPAHSTDVKVKVADDSNLVSLQVGKDQIEIQLCLPNVVRVNFLRDGMRSPDTTSIAKTNWGKVDATVESQVDPLVISTKKMVIKVSRDPYRLSVYDLAGHLLIKEHDVEGVRERGVRFTTAPYSHFYGLRGWEYLDDSKGEMELAPSAQPYQIKAGAEGQTGGPLIWSNLGYGVFVDSDGGFCHIKNPTDVQFFDLSRQSVSYYVIVGNAYEVQEAIADITGKPPMFPKWALGFSNSEFADMNEELCAANVAGYRSRGIPFDLYTFDFQWKAWGEDHYGELRWNEVNFPNGPSGAFKKRMDAQGVKLAGIMKPRIHIDTEEGRYATEHGFWVKGRAVYNDYFSHQPVNDLDFSIEACRKWFWQHSEDAFKTGIVGWWNDEADAWGSTREGMYMAQAVYEGQREFTKDRIRVWTNNRNFYSGAQRYAYATWSGDIESGFSVMQEQRERLLCSSNVGQARWGMDTGGFNNNYHIQGEELNESYARWIEFAAFVPIFRTHGTSYRQPWRYGPRAEAAAKKAILLRYSLIPYMYSYEHLLNQTGIGLVHPLVWDYPSDAHFFNHVDSWMFGQYLLAAPVVDEGQTSKSIYLPSGDWIDYFRGDRLKGGQTIQYSVDAKTLLDIPIFIKDGAIIPSMKAPNYVGEKPVTEVQVDVFPNSTPSSFTYYDDDGATYDYEKGIFFEQKMETSAKDHGTLFTIAPRSGTYTPDLKWYLLKIHNRASSAVKADQNSLPQLSTIDDLTNSNQESWITTKDTYGPATYIKVKAVDPKKIWAQY